MPRHYKELIRSLSGVLVESVEQPWFATRHTTQAGDNRRSRSATTCGDRLSTLRPGGHRALGHIKRTATLSLQGVRPYLQRPDQDAPGAVAHAREVGSAGEGDDRRGQPHQGG